MTCIAAIAEGGKVWMGGDSLSGSGYSYHLRTQPKVFRNGEFLMGSTGPSRLSQLLEHSFSPPTLTEGEKFESYLATRFTVSLRNCLKDGGLAEREKDRESTGDGKFLLGFRGRLFSIDCWYAFTETTLGYDACGCGEDYALGSLYSTKSGKPEDRLRTALEAAERHSMGVRGPFTILSL
jgi:hypothetical protein